MKITGVDVHLASEWRTLLFVVVETDAGLYGVGESSMTGREKAVAGAVDHFRPLLVGEDPFRTEHLWQTLFRGGFYPSGIVLSAAIAAIDIALWDIKAKALSVPLYQLFGGRVRDRLLTYCHLYGDSAEAIVAAARSAVADGWKCLRWEPHFDADGVIVSHRAASEGLAEWAAMRDAVGDDVELCYDVHTKLDVPDAVRFCRGVEPFRPFFIEDPLRSENPDLYRSLRSQTSVPLAAGEQYPHKWAFKRVVEERLVDFARIDLGIAGGFTEARKIAGWCETNSIDVAVHNPVGPVSTAACLHFNLACTNFGVMELPKRPGETMSDVVTGQPEWRDGYLLPNDRPGLGIQFLPEKLSRYPFEMTELPHLRKTDGTFSNW